MIRSNMKLFLIVLVVLISLAPIVSVFAQKQPVTWDIYVDSVKADKGTIVFRAQIQPSWHLYSQHIEEGGPMPTEFKFDGSDYRTIGNTYESGKRIIYHDAIYDMQVSYYSDKVVFNQRIEMLKKTGFIKGSIEYMVCSGEVCMPGRKAFSVPMPAR